MTQQSPLKAEDIAKLRWVLDPCLSPDGTEVAYVLKDVDPSSNLLTYRYRLATASTSQAVEDSLDFQESNDVWGQLRLPGFSAHLRSPQWLSAQQIAFLAKPDNASFVQLYSLDLPTGSLVQHTHIREGLSSYAVSSKGTLAYSAPVRDSGDTYGEYQPGQFRVIKRLAYKTDGKGYWDNRWQRLFIRDLATQSAAETDTEISAGPFDHYGARWAPEGHQLAFISSGVDNPDSSALRHVFIASFNDTQDQHSVEQLTSSLVVQSLSWSPSGRYLALLAHDNSEDRCTTLGIWLVDVKSKKLTNLTADIDRPAGDLVTDDMNVEADAATPCWSADESTIFSIMTDEGCSRIVRISVKGEQSFELGERCSHSAERHEWHESRFSVQPVFQQESRVFSLSSNGHQFALAMSTTEHPGDIYFLDAANQLKRLTAVNHTLLSARHLAVPEAISIDSIEGRQVGGWLLLPPAGEAPYPLVLHVHGGPHSAHSPAFNFELHHLAARGYAVLYINPHGSHSHGRDINMGTRLNWGGQDFTDLMNAVDLVCQREDIDAEQLGVAGGSYGGWMVNYIVSHDHRFKAAVAQRSSSNRISTFTSSSSGYKHARWEAPGYPWEHLDYFAKISPVLQADQVRTPLLLIHAEYDHLCPLTQAEEMYTALKVLGKTVELLVFLDESHHMGRIGKPVNRIERLKRTAAWIDRYVQNPVP